MGSNIPNVACGMYLVKTTKVKEILFHRHGFEVDQDVAAQMLVDGTLAYVPIDYRERLGHAEAPTWRQGLWAFFAIMSIASRCNPVVLFGLFASVALAPALVILGHALHDYLLLNAYRSGLFLASLMLFVIGCQGSTVATMAHAQQNGAQDNQPYIT